MIHCGFGPWPFDDFKLCGSFAGSLIPLVDTTPHTLPIIQPPPKYTSYITLKAPRLCLREIYLLHATYDKITDVLSCQPTTELPLCPHNMGPFAANDSPSTVKPYSVAQASCLLLIFLTPSKINLARLGLTSAYSTSADKHLSGCCHFTPRFEN